MSTRYSCCDDGERIVVRLDGDPVKNGDTFDIKVKEPGDFSPYVLRLVDTAGNPLSLDGRLAEIEFSFKVGCPSPFDCRTDALCLPPATPAPRIDYLARDYTTFRRVMLDRLSLLLPDWRERHAADLGVMLVEMLAFVGDRLTYEQDAIATEAYLGTARLRTSVRRHARLVDYKLHDGCNARAFPPARRRQRSRSAGRTSTRAPSCSSKRFAIREIPTRPTPIRRTATSCG